MAAQPNANPRLDHLSRVLASDRPPPPAAAVHGHLIRAHGDTPPPVIRAALNRAIRRLSKPRPLAALRLLLLMPRLPVSPDHYTLPFSLNAAASLGLLRLGASLHAVALRLALAPSCLPVANAIVDLYAKCSDLPAAHAALASIPSPDAVSFNSLLCTHARFAAVPAAESLFTSMPSRTQVSWNAMVVVYVNAGDFASARRVFDEMPARDLASWSVLIVGYCKHGFMPSARELFDKMPKKDLVTWTAMINGYAQNGRPEDSLASFRKLEAAGIEPDAATMVGVISAASQIGSMELAGQIGAIVDNRRIERNEKVLTALVDMHAKCGNVEQALNAFREIEQPDAYPYTALISGLATHGHAKLALQVFERMQAQAVRPDPITFVGVLTACSHAGLVDLGLDYWEAMVQDYGINRRADHYACVVDMLGRAGRLQEAFEMIQTMPMGPHPGALGALLSACKTHDNVEIAEVVADKLFELEPRNTGNYIMLSSIYAGKEQWEEAERVRSLMKTKLPFKQPGSSWV
ncbi:putative pentatricopeptide repeat-containing protein At3g49142 [Lolium perenne]|uniref:putative pentatricopeptide repeat-containing protein At3g49142 n=1 Tax=Lolium perenne TaxID=4522 RepID=UPI0021EB4D06|nr:putative pentatricopeptide repeat-containing protein At5g37570 [Lolium perenne]XP_051227722.1 putative pentatricopeptide repeat-containing protein At5g37570 [Lolium perenne]